LPLRREKIITVIITSHFYLWKDKPKFHPLKKKTGFLKKQNRPPENLIRFLIYRANYRYPPMKINPPGTHILAKTAMNQINN
jgi:hypothetical protein